MISVRNIPLTIWESNSTSPIGIRCEIGGMKFIAALDSGEENDIHMEPIDAWRLGIISTDDVITQGSSIMGGPYGKFIEFNHAGYPRFMTEIEIEDLGGTFNIPTTIYERGPLGPTLLPMTYFNRLYSINISRDYITFLDKHEGGYRYIPTDVHGWTTSNESRTPPILGCHIDNIPFTAILDTGAINGRGALTTEIANKINVEQYPSYRMVMEGGKLRKIYRIPFMLEDLGPFTIDFTITDQYPDHNIIPIDPFIANGGSVTFNENSVEFF